MASKEMIAQATCYAKAGYTIIPLKGKVPAVENWTQADYTWPEEVQTFYQNWPGNFGVVLSRRDLVIDIDPRNFKGEDKPHVRLFKTLGIEIKTFGAIARTGGGGIHIYLRLPEGVKVREIHPDYPGIEFKSRGRQVVGVGSTHPDTGAPYTWAGGLPLEQIKDAPVELVSLIRRFELGSGAAPNGAEHPIVDEGATDADQAAVGRYIDYLKTAPPAIQGAQGDQTTFNVACKGRDLGFSREKTLALMLEYYNHRCIPDWKPEELRVKIRNAYSYATGKVGADLPANDFTAVVDTNKHKLFRGWDRFENGKLQKTLNNVFNFFIIGDSPLPGTIGYDEFNGQVRVLKRLPWHETPLPVAGLEWKDEDSVQLRLWLSREKQFDVQLKVIDEAVLVAAQQNILHPVKDYLRGLRWDGVPRLESWLIDAAGAADNRFVREASKKFLLQAVSRIYHPGSKADHIIVLEGEQGVGKSTIVEILGGIWYADIIIDPHSRDTVDAMRGKWFLEFSEMVAPTRQDANAMKAFITRRIDRVRLAYGRRSVDLPRQCVFIGTINPDATQEYLTDDTGGRRWWPIRVGKVNFGALQKMRDQIFAEAVDLVMKGEATHIIDHEILEIARAEQRARQTTDPWLGVIQESLGDKKYGFITTKDIWVFTLKGSESNLSVVHQRRIASCLKELGFVPLVRRDPTDKTKVIRGFVHRDTAGIEKQLGDMLN